jgi:drug/metabolite transporter (DMT)-like permease
VFLFWRDGRLVWSRFKHLGIRDSLVSISLALGFIFYVLSLFNTTVANTVLILSTGPLIAAVLAWVFLRERIGWGTLIAIAGAITGVSIMVSDGIAGADRLGLLYAFVAVIAFAVLVVTLRATPSGQDMMLATAMAGIVAAGLSLPLLPTLKISQSDLWFSMALGSVQVGVGFILITLGSRSVPAAQIPLLVLAETALAPLWVWWIIKEVPAQNTLFGGTIILCAVIWQSVIGVMHTRRNRSDQAV